jgi:hypothetical protein
MFMRFVNISGQKFERLLAIEPIRGGKKIKWRCLCDCGNERLIDGAKLRNGESRSCGCLQKELQSSRIAQSNLRHGHNKKGQQTKTHKSWVAMLHRCRGQNYSDYYRYGGRGITVCERWHLFENFLADMGERPEGKTLDRIDVYGNYTPENCRWATLSEQQRNKQCHRKI